MSTHRTSFATASSAAVLLQVFLLFAQGFALRYQVFVLPPMITFVVIDYRVEIAILLLLLCIIDLGVRWSAWKAAAFIVMIVLASAVIVQTVREGARERDRNRMIRHSE